MKLGNIDLKTSDGEQERKMKTNIYYSKKLYRKGKKSR